MHPPDDAARPRFLASGDDTLAGPWDLAVGTGPDGPVLEHRCRSGGGSIGTILPLERRVFGPVSAGPWKENGMLRGAVVDGIVTSQAWVVRIALRDGASMRANLARVPEDIAPGISAFIAFLPAGSEPLTVVAEDERGAALGSQPMSFP